MKTNICFFCGDATLGGGTERVCSSLAALLSENQKYSVTILSVYEKNKAPIFQTPAAVIRAALRKKPVANLLLYSTLYAPLLSFIKKNNIQVLIDVDGVLDIISLPVRIFCGVKIISWEHFAFDETLGTAYRTRLRKITAKRVDAVVTLTNGDAERFNREFRLRRPAECIRNSAEIKACGNYNASSKILMTAGGLVPVKGYDALLETAAALAARQIEFHWHIFGEGELRPTLEAKIKELSLENRVTLCGFVQTLEPYYNDAAVYVLTSKSEGLPTVLLEAKKHGLPIAAFDCSFGVRELVRDNVNGLLVPPGDTNALSHALERMLCDENLRKTFSDNAALFTEEFAPEFVLSKWDALIEEITKS